MNSNSEIILSSIKINIDSILKNISNRIKYYEDNAPLIHQNTKISDELIFFHQNNLSGKNSINSIKELSKRGSISTVSGQQVGLGVSPLLALYKFIHNEVSSEILESKLKRKVIPVFWLQTEDHDHTEISNCNFLNKNLEVSSIASNSLSSEYPNRKSIGEIKLSNKTDKLILEFIKNNYGESLSVELEEFIETSFGNGISYQESFIRSLNTFFPNTRTVFIDSRLECFNEARKKCMLFSLNNWEIINQKLKDLSKIIKIKENSPLFFIHPNGKDGNRYRLDFQNETFNIPSLNKKYSKNELFTLIKHSPDQFSTSAILRPILQDTILPVVSYIAGPTEFKYLNETKSIYETANITPPNIIPRLQVAVLPKKVFSQSKEFIYDIDIFSNDFETLRKKILENSVESNLDKENLQNLIKADIISIKENLEKFALRVDQTLNSPLQKTTQGIEENINKFLNKYERALFQKNEVSYKRIENLLKWLFPELDSKKREPQERVLSAVFIYLEFGGGFFTELYDRIKNELIKNYL